MIAYIMRRTGFEDVSDRMHELSDADDRPSGVGMSGFFKRVAVKELNFLENPRFPLKGSFKGDIDIGIGT